MLLRSGASWSYWSSVGSGDPSPSSRSGRSSITAGWWPVRAAGEHADGAAVVRAGGQRAADGELDVRGAVLAGEQQHVDHLPGGLRGSVAVGQRRPQLVEAARPSPALALLVQRDRPGERAGLVDQQLEVVVKLGGDPEPAGQAVVAGDRLAVVRDRDLPGADLGQDPQPDQADRHRVAVLTNRHHRLRVDPRARVLAGLRPLGGQRSQQRPLRGQRLTDRAALPGDLPPEVGLAAGEQPRVQLGEAPHRRDRHQMAAAEPADLALDPALLMRAAQPDQRELRLEHVVRAQRDEPVGLDPPAAPAAPA